jgi:hypothetical protein
MRAVMPTAPEASTFGQPPLLSFAAVLYTESTDLP